MRYNARMLTKIVIRNFKKFRDVEVPLGNGFVFIGPNNSGKTSALQALTLWHTCLQKWMARKTSPAKRSGITLNRKDLVFSPVAHSSLLWRNRNVASAGVPRILAEFIVYGMDNDGEEWKCGLELEYTNKESVYCRPLRIDKSGKERMPIPPQVKGINIVMLPPMSGLADEEPLVQPGRINVLLGQGRTAEVLRNICFGLYEKEDGGWENLCEHLRELFGIEPHDPINTATGAIEINYKEKDNDKTFDLQSLGRGAQQVMLILAFLLYHDKGTVFLLDEPDAHLEILSQDAIYRLLKRIARERNSQIIVASHSEKLLSNAADDGSVVAFVGEKPRILGEGSTAWVRKALSDIGWEVYYEAGRKGWILYVEGKSDIHILQEFADRMNHAAKKALMNCLWRPIGTDKGTAKVGEFAALQQAVPGLRGLMLTDAEQKFENLPGGLQQIWWSKREIENYLCTRNTLLAYAGDPDIYGGIIFSKGGRQKMVEEIEIIETALAQLSKPGIFDDTGKSSENLEALMKKFSKAAKVRTLAKKDFFQLVKYVPEKEIDPEIREKLDAIAEIAGE